MKLLFLIIFISSCSSRQVNIPDSEDMNKTPQSMESRENESWNRGDSLDGNKIPSVNEERKIEEERDYYNDPPVF